MGVDNRGIADWGKPEGEKRGLAAKPVKQAEPAPMRGFKTVDRDYRPGIENL